MSYKHAAKIVRTERLFTQRTSVLFGVRASRQEIEAALGLQLEFVYEQGLGNFWSYFGAIELGGVEYLTEVYINSANNLTSFDVEERYITKDLAEAMYAGLALGQFQLIMLPEWR